MTITRTINGELHTFELTEQEAWTIWKEMNDLRDRNYIVSHIAENYDGILDEEMYERLQSEEVIDEIYEEARFRSDHGWGSFEAEADMIIESKVEELEDGIDLTEDEED